MDSYLRVIFGSAEAILVKCLKIYIYFLISHSGTSVLQVITAIYKFYMWLGTTPVNLFILGIQTYANFHEFDNFKDVIFSCLWDEKSCVSSLKPIVRKCTSVILWWTCVSCCLSSIPWRMLLLTSFWAMRYCTGCLNPCTVLEYIS